MRGRRAEDFIEYFTGTICSVPQFLKEDEFVALSRALIDDPDTVKMLSMLALSAHSYLPSPKNTESPSQEGESP
jgi:CRISPR-associated protein Cmx8